MSRIPAKYEKPARGLGHITLPSRQKGRTLILDMCFKTHIKITSDVSDPILWSFVVAAQVNEPSQGSHVELLFQQHLVRW